MANKPGVTRSLNFYGNALGAQLVDLPGYGFAYAADAAVDAWQEAMRGYLAQRGAPLRVLLCIDARQSLKQSDRDFLLWLDREAKVPLHVVMTKCDLVVAKELCRRYTLLGEELRSLQLRHHVPPHFMVSSKNKGGIDLLRASLTSAFPEKILGRASAALSKRAKSAASRATDDTLATITTPAAREFAVRAAAKRAAREQRKAAERKISIGRDERAQISSDMWARRVKRRR